MKDYLPLIKQPLPNHVERSFYQAWKRTAREHGYKGFMAMPRFLYRRFMDFQWQLLSKMVPYSGIRVKLHRWRGVKIGKGVHIDPIDMHHVMAFADIYIGDSQTMAAEAGVLGVPFIRYNDFVGRIGYLRELEDNYNLGFGIKSGQEEVLMQTLKNLLHMSNRKEVFQERRKKMLDDKIDYAKFLTWFIANFPKSKQIMKDNPEYQYNFK